MTKADAAVWREIDEPLLAHEIDALEFLSRGPDCIGLIDDEPKLAAALVFCDLQNRGLIASDKIDGGLWWFITAKGSAAYAEARALAAQEGGER